MICVLKCQLSTCQVFTCQRGAPARSIGSSNKVSQDNVCVMHANLSSYTTHITTPFLLHLYYLLQTLLSCLYSFAFTSTIISLVYCSLSLSTAAIYHTNHLCYFVLRYSTTVYTTFPREQFGSDSVLQYSMLRLPPFMLLLYVVQLPSQPSWELTYACPCNISSVCRPCANPCLCAIWS